MSLVAYSGVAGIGRNVWQKADAAYRDPGDGIGAVDRTNQRQELGLKTLGMARSHA